MSIEVPLDEVIHFDVVTHNPSTGAVSDADSTPTFAVYEEATDTDIGVGGNLTKRTSLTGNYRGTFTASAANGFEAGKWYAVIASATVNSIAGKTVAMHFRAVLAEAVVGSPKADAAYFAGTAYATALAAEVDAVWDESISGHQTLATTGRSLTLASSILAETTTAGVPTSTVVKLTAGSAVNDFYNDLQFVITSGALTGQTRTVLDYDGATTTVTVDEAFTSAPAAGVSVLIRALHTHPISQIADAIWDEATSGHTTAGTFGEQLKTDVDAILDDTGTAGVVVASGSKSGYALSATGLDATTLPANLITATSIATDAITAAKIAADAIGSSELAATAAEEIADAVLARAVSNVESTANRHSLAAVVMINTNSSRASTTLTAKKPSDDSTFDTYTLTTATSADAITGIS